MGGLSVALRKESVDRNTRSQGGILRRALSLSARRAWIEISGRTLPLILTTSLSARRAWIEISYEEAQKKVCGVALRKESVDRNAQAPSAQALPCWSLSARRAWIEIFSRSAALCCISGSLSARRAWIEITITKSFNADKLPVALRKESVDRNRRQHTS